MAEGGDFRHLSTSHNARESRLKSTFDQEIHPSVCPLDADWSKFAEVQRGTSGRSGLLLQTAVSVDSPPFGHPGVSRHSKAKHAWNRGEIDTWSLVAPGNAVRVARGDARAVRVCVGIVADSSVVGTGCGRRGGTFGTRSRTVPVACVLKGIRPAGCTVSGSRFVPRP